MDNTNMEYLTTDMHDNTYHLNKSDNFVYQFNKNGRPRGWYCKYTSWNILHKGIESNKESIGVAKR